MKKNKGITLVALIITIIVLLILAIISVKILQDTGIISNANLGVDKYKINQLQEKLSTAVASAVMKNNNILKEDNYKIEKALEEELSTDVVTFLPSCNEEEYYLIYESYLWKINRNTKVVEYISKADSSYTGDGTILDGLSVLDQIDKAKQVEKISTQEINGGYNIVYSTGINQKDLSNEKTWSPGDIGLACQIYCAENIMIYDGTAPYVPVMARFYRWHDDRRYI